MFRCTSLRFATTREINIALSHMGMTLTDASDTKTLKKKYHDLVRRNHPDAGGDERKMRDVINAFKVLTEVTAAEREHFTSKPSPPKADGYGYDDGYGYQTTRDHGRTNHRQRETNPAWEPPPHPYQGRTRDPTKDYRPRETHQERRHTQREETYTTRDHGSGRPRGPGEYYVHNGDLRPPSWEERFADALPQNMHQLRQRVVQICGIVFMWWILTSLLFPNYER